MIKNIYGNVANMAAILGMSYINSSTFDPDAIEDLGLSLSDPMKPGYQASRTIRLNNTFQGTRDDYDVRFRIKSMGLALLTAPSVAA